MKKSEISSDLKMNVIKDFNAFLSFIGEGLEVKGVRCWLPMGILTTLNSQLSRSITVLLKRPQQNSYPHIHGLYLLFRISGLGRVDHLEKNTFLSVDDEMLDQWNALNDEEQYFSLFESWWCRGNDAVLSETTGNIYDLPFSMMNFYTKIAKNGLVFDTSKEQDRLRYPGFYIIALMELFGLIEIIDGEPEEGKGWRIESIKPTERGDFLLGSLLEIEPEFFKTPLYGLKNQEIIESMFQEWATQMKPSFPKWKNHLTLPIHQFQPTPHVFRISLGKAWRRILISGHASLDQLSSSILEAFDFENDHLYQFTYQNRVGQSESIDHPMLETHHQTTDQTKVGDLPLEEGMRMDFFFDFGDCWEFDVVLEALEANVDDLKQSKVLEKKGKAPQQYGY